MDDRKMIASVRSAPRQGVFTAGHEGHYMARQRRTRFDLDDYVALMTALTRDPLTILTHFRAQGIHTLDALDGWRELCKLQPSTAQTIREVAGLFGIPERPEKPPCVKPSVSP